MRAIQAMYVACFLLNGTIFFGFAKKKRDNKVGMNK